MSNMDLFVTSTLYMLLESEPSLFSADQMGGYAVTALFTLTNLVVAYIAISLLFKKLLLPVINKRQEQINASVDEAAKAEEEAKKHEETSKQSIEEARVQASEILENARENAEKQADIIKEKANSDAADILNRAESDAKRMKRVALEEMKDEISDLAVVIAGKVIGEVVDEYKLKELSTKHTNEVLGNEVNEIG